jgi:hypothetical protein
VSDFNTEHKKKSSSDEHQEESEPVSMEVSTPSKLKMNDSIASFNVTDKEEESSLK